MSLTYPYRLALGRSHVAQKQYGQAIPILEQLTQKSLTDPVASFALGQAYDAIGAWEVAVTEYRKAVDLAKDSARNSIEYRLHLARRYFDNERYFQAIETWQVAARLQPLDVDLRLSMARAYARVSDPLQAARTYERVLQIEPGNTVALQGLQAIRGRLPAGLQRGEKS